MTPMGCNQQNPDLENSRTICFFQQTNCKKKTWKATYRLKEIVNTCQPIAMFKMWTLFGVQFKQAVEKNAIYETIGIMDIYEIFDNINLLTLQLYIKGVLIFFEIDIEKCTDEIILYVGYAST